MQALFLILARLWAKEPAQVIGWLLGLATLFIVEQAHNVGIEIDPAAIHPAVSLLGPPLVALLIRFKVYSKATVEGIVNEHESTIDVLATKLQEAERQIDSAGPAQPRV